MTSFVLAGSYSWKQETHGLVGCSDCELAGWGMCAWTALAGWRDGWLGLWVLDCSPSQGFLPSLGRSPAPDLLLVASAATKGEPPGEGTPSWAHLPTSSPFVSFLIGGPILLGYTRLPATKRGGSSSCHQVNVTYDQWCLTD